MTTSMAARSCARSIAGSAISPKSMKAAKVVEPAAQESRDQIRFGATVELADEDDARRTLTIVGDDEADAIGRADRLERAPSPAPWSAQGRRRANRSPARGQKSYEVLRSATRRLNVRRKRVRGGLPATGRASGRNVSGVTDT